MFVIARFDRRKKPKDNIREASILADKIECNVHLHFPDPQCPVNDKNYDDHFIVITYPNCSIPDKVAEYIKICGG